MQIPAAGAPAPIDPTWPVVAAYGAGVDSTAMLIELIERGERIDVVLFADTGGERPETYAFLELFTAWLAARGIRLVVVRYRAKRFKNWPPYATLEENLLTNQTLPSIAFGGAGHTCSAKWKIAPQEAWTAAWDPAIEAWARGGKVVRLIGYDASPQDQRRYAHALSIQADDRYHYRYPLIEWGWTRADCEARIIGAGLPVPPKSSCWFCKASKPAEIDALPKALLRRIVLLEARARPRLRTIDGLWGRPVKGTRGAIPRPGSMTEYIRTRGLLPAGEIAAIERLAPGELVRFCDLAALTDEARRPAMAAWLKLFDRAAELGLESEGVLPLYPARVDIEGAAVAEASAGVLDSAA